MSTSTPENRGTATSETTTGFTPTGRSKPTRRWRVVDIVVASVIGVAAGVVFWAWGLAYTPIDSVLSFSGGFEGLMNGGWLFAGVLGGIVIRKPGAALYTEVLAAVVSMLIGTQWGFSVLIWGIVQGLGAEIVLALFLYKSWRLGIVLLAGAVAGLAVGLMDTTFASGPAAYAAASKTIYIVTSIVSGTVIAGLLSWLAARGLARTGALDRFASGRSAGTRV
ncbi:ECF transporter S component [Frigoribacterium faeni]|uniref:ABC transporter permease n=1 Tax=Frigoribacterium faeni TaxID=145483 RepID=A0A7W3JID2_9MICO|nr:ECF transporter S component [Frigoribacterium faeni]MBA8813383.1 energy-coupling factor transport system substrate-specific component [Frigoribacterium faeni]BFF14615.1 ECF transporter S component [Microbacterium flavescens]GEK83101.1 ABC transporter permease [Frigoribacterium faeni]